MEKTGSLIVIGTGIKPAGDITISAKAHMIQADVVFMVMPDMVAKQWIHSLHSNVIDLSELYADDKSRHDTYQEMTQALVDAVKSGLKVCAAFYGHPGVFVFAGHAAISHLKPLGFDASMTPGISAEDCLFADLGLDPGKTGCLSIEATQFLFYKRPFDYYSLVILWQIGLVGDHTLKLSQTNNYKKGLKVLTQTLSEYYPDDHIVIIYEAATIAILAPRIDYITLKDLPTADLSAASTLVIPPCQQASFDHQTLSALGICEKEIKVSLKIN